MSSVDLHSHVVNSRRHELVLDPISLFDLLLLRLKEEKKKKKKEGDKGQLQSNKERESSLDSPSVERFPHSEQ